MTNIAYINEEKKLLVVAELRCASCSITTWAQNNGLTMLRSHVPEEVVRLMTALQKEKEESYNIIMLMERDPFIKLMSGLVHYFVSNGAERDILLYGKHEPIPGGNAWQSKIPDLIGGDPQKILDHFNKNWSEHQKRADSLFNISYPIINILLDVNNGANVKNVSVFFRENIKEFEEVLIKLGYSELPHENSTLPEIRELRDKVTELAKNGLDGRIVDAASRAKTLIESFVNKTSSSSWKFWQK